MKFIKKVAKKILKKTMDAIIRILYPQIPKRVLNRWPRGRVLVMGFYQRILRQNANVAWPVHWSSIVYSPERIERRCPDWATPGFNIGQYIQAINGIVFGKHVRLGPGVKIVSADHNVCNFDEHIPADPIIINDYCWVGANSVILAGVELAEHTIVAAGSVVTKSILEENCIIGGTPARVLKRIPAYTGNKSDKA